VTGKSSSMLTVLLLSIRVFTMLPTMSTAQTYLIKFRFEAGFFDKYHSKYIR